MCYVVGTLYLPFCSITYNKLENKKWQCSIANRKVVKSKAVDNY